MSGAKAKKKSDPGYGGILLAFEPVRSEKIEEKLFGLGVAAESFSNSDWKFEFRELVILALQPSVQSVSGMALMEGTGGYAGTARRLMRLWEPVMFDPPLTAEECPPLRNFRRWVSTSENVRHIPYLHWEALLTAMKAARPEVATELDALVAMREESERMEWGGQKATRLLEQRDAIGLSLDIASLDRSSIFRNWDGASFDTADSALDLLDCQPIYEQDILRNDEQVFKDLLTKGMQNSRFVGNGGREVRVYVTDKKPLETVLGIDLLIYQECYRSFLLLQYKVMQQTNGDNGPNWNYPADEQMRQQLASMDEAMRLIKQQPSVDRSMWDWRLNPDPFYFKFCKRIHRLDRKEALASGITLNHEHLAHFLLENVSLGKRDGRSIGYENCPRYLNNTQFVDLAREGWIGCDRRGYEILVKILKMNINDGKIAMLSFIKGSGAENASGRRRRTR